MELSPLENPKLEDLVEEHTTDTSLEKNATKKAFLVDTLANNSYSLIVGAILDYSAGVSPLGILVSRSYGAVINSLTGGAYGWWTEQTYTLTRTNENHSYLRKRIPDLLAFNTFQVPAYATVVAVGTYFSEGQINWDKVATASKNLALISPLIGPTMGMNMNLFRWMFGIKSTVEGVYKGRADV